jgi:hypothetical protein
MADTILYQHNVNNVQGVTPLPDTIIADDAATLAILSLDGSTMLDAAVTVTLRTQSSIDDGATYPFVNTSQVSGGQVDKHGAPVTEYNCIAPLMPSIGQPRHIKGDVTVTGGKLSTAVTALTR